MKQKNRKISSLVFSDDGNVNFDDEVVFVLCCSIIKHLKKNKSLRNWFESLNIRELEVFYSKDRIFEILNKLKNTSSEELERYVVFNAYKKLGKHLSEITFADMFGLLPKSLRKKYAMYYTEKDVANFLAKLALTKKTEKVLDPSCGDGRLLLALHAIKPRLELHGFDTSLLSDFEEKNFKHYGQIDFLQIDKNFKEFADQKYDLIVMNPPFTRQSNLSADYRNFLLSKFYADVGNVGQMGLHGYFILQADKFLKNNGTLALILPASTLYSKYAKKVRNLLLEKYRIKFCISYEDDKSFSEGSTIKEIIIIAEKKNRQNKCTFVSLKTNITKKNTTDILESIESHESSEIVEIIEVDINKIKQSDNWLEFFINKQNDFRETDPCVKNSKITKIKHVFSMRRGTESFGPEFFFLPNKLWKIKTENNSEVIISNIISKEEIIFPRQYLIPGLTSPRMYSDKIVPKIKEYFVALPPIKKEKFPKQIQKYIEYGIKAGLAISKNKFSQKKPWYSFLYEQLTNESFFGNLFILRKLRLNTMGVIAHYLPEKHPASKGFYVVRCEEKYAKSLAAWLNSSYFIAHLIQNRRNIASNWGEVMISDLLEFPCIDPSKISNLETKTLEKAFDEFSSNEIPSILDRNSCKRRSNLDNVIAKIISDKVLQRKNIEFLENLNAQIPVIRN